jgi:hypothetical protein
MSICKSNPIAKAECALRDLEKRHAGLTQRLDAAKAAHESALIA